MKTLKSSTYEIRLRAVQAVLDGMLISDVAKAYQTDRATIHRWLKRYKENNGAEGLKRKQGSGRPRKLEDLNCDDLKSIILKPASDFGYETNFWTCKRLKVIIEKQFKIKVSKWTIWRGLREAGMTYQKPERKYHEACEEKRKDWLENTLPEILKTVKKYRAILYFEDESNISLTALLGKTWAPCGETPKQEVTGNRGSVSAMSAISQSGYLLFTLHQTKITSDEVIQFMDQLLKHHANRHIVLVMDQARPHTSKKVQNYINDQKRLHVFYLPPYSPDWNPDEQVWNYLKNHALKGHQAKTRDEINKLAEKKLTEMSKDPSIVRGIFFRCHIADILH